MGEMKQLVLFWEALNLKYIIENYLDRVFYRRTVTIKDSDNDLWWRAFYVKRKIKAKLNELSKFEVTKSRYWRHLKKK